LLLRPNQWRKDATDPKEGVLVEEVEDLGKEKISEGARGDVEVLEEVEKVVIDLEEGGLADEQMSTLRKRESNSLFSR